MERRHTGRTIVSYVYAKLDDPNSNEAVHNLVMDHTNSAIFQRNYLSRMIRYDIQGLYGACRALNRYRPNDERNMVESRSQKREESGTMSMVEKTKRKYHRIC